MHDTFEINAVNVVAFTVAALALAWVFVKLFAAIGRGSAMLVLPPRHTLPPQRPSRRVLPPLPPLHTTAAAGAFADDIEFDARATATFQIPTEVPNGE